MSLGEIPPIHRQSYAPSRIDVEQWLILRKNVTEGAHERHRYLLGIQVNGYLVSVLVTKFLEILRCDIGY